MSEEGFIVEFHQVGNSVKVTAFDPATLIEVSIVGSPNATQEQMATIAVRKLLNKLNKDS